MNDEERYTQGIQVRTEVLGEKACRAIFRKFK